GRQLPAFSFQPLANKRINSAVTHSSRAGGQNSLYFFPVLRKERKNKGVSSFGFRVSGKPLGKERRFEFQVSSFEKTTEERSFRLPAEERLSAVGTRQSAKPGKIAPSSQLPASGKA